MIKSVNNDKVQLCTFLINKQLFAIDIKYIKEVNPNLNIFSVPSAPEYVKGLLNVRGRIVMIIDVAVKFGKKSIHITKQCHNIILKNYSELQKVSGIELTAEHKLMGDFSIGFIVEEVFDILEFNSNEILPTPAHLSEIDSKYINGVIKFKDKLLLVLNSSNIVLQ
ncbi:MAG TPA: chemotaxis protein CheW [bacterium]|nr:chemotaxis protein CheW [bacterium]